jgi:hypothetical protein
MHRDNIDRVALAIVIIGLAGAIAALLALVPWR